MAIRIGKGYIERADGQSRLCAQIRKGGKETVLWFGVPAEQESCLSLGRADPFALLLLPAAMRDGEELLCEDPMSERLHYQLTNDLVPALAGAGDLYREVPVTAPLTAEKVPSEGAVACGFSAGVDSLYSVWLHGEDCEYPLTHLAVFNSGVYEGPEFRTSFRSVCRRCGDFARERGLKTVFVDSNAAEVLPERYLDVVTIRLAAFALALQGLASVFLISSGMAIEEFKVTPHHCAEFDPLTVNCVSTESLQFYLSGIDTRRVVKLEKLSSWEPSFRWLSPCVFGEPGKKNCGHCKKCMRDLAILYALGRLDRYAAVFDVADYRRHLPQRLGFLLADADSLFSRDTVALLKERGAYIPPLAYRCAEMFSGAMDRIREENRL